MIRFVEKWHLRTSKINGCAVDLVSRRTELPIFKPWRIDSTCAELSNRLDPMTCPGHSQHEPCAGSETKNTENYTTTFVNLVHRAFANHVRSNSARDNVRSNSVRDAWQLTENLLTRKHVTT